MDAIFFLGCFVFLIIYIFVCNEVMRAAKENELKAPAGYFVVSFFCSPVVGLLLILVRKDVPACKVEVETYEQTI